MISLYLEKVFWWTPDAATAYFTLGLLIATIGLIFVARSQLKKTRDATNSDSLNDYLQFFRSKEMAENRKKLADHISSEGYDNNSESKIKVKFADLIKKANYSNDELKWIATTKNLIEDVIYNFEILGYYTLDKGIYSPNDTCQLFSYEIQQYWVLIKDVLGYIDFIRENEFSGEKDLYVYFEDVFYKMMVLEVLSLEEELDYFERWKYKNISIKKSKTDGLCKCHIDKKIKYTPLFLDEERNISTVARSSD